MIEHLKTTSDHAEFYNLNYSGTYIKHSYQHKEKCASLKLIEWNLKHLILIINMS